MNKKWMTKKESRMKMHGRLTQEQGALQIHTEFFPPFLVTAVHALDEYLGINFLCWL
jgi:hypothetical protein